MESDGSPIGAGVYHANLQLRESSRWGWAPITQWIAETLDGWGHPHRRPAAVYIEKPALVRASGPDAGFLAGRAVQVAWTALGMLGWPEPELIQPDRWKRLAGVPPRGRWCSYQELVDELDRTKDPRPKRADAKTGVYLRALQLGFQPGGSQDAADAALVAVAGHSLRKDTTDAR